MRSSIPDIVGVMVSEDADPIGTIPSHEVEVIQVLKIAVNGVVIGRF